MLEPTRVEPLSGLYVKGAHAIRLVLKKAKSYKNISLQLITIVYGECHYTECRYTKCRYA